MLDRPLNEKDKPICIVLLRKAFYPLNLICVKIFLGLLGLYDAFSFYSLPWVRFCMMRALKMYV